MYIKKKIYNEIISEPLELKNSYKNNQILIHRLMTKTPTTSISSNQLKKTISETENHSSIDSKKIYYKKSTINKLLTEEQYFTPALKKLRKEYENKLKNEIKRNNPITEGKIINKKLFKRKINEIEQNSKIKKKKINPILNITKKDYDRLKEIENRNFTVKFKNDFHKLLDYEIKEFDNVIKNNRIYELKLMKNIYNVDIYFNDISLSKQLVDLNHQYQKEYDEIRSKRNIETPDFINKLMINKNIIDTKMKIDLIRIKNENKNKTKEKIRRTLLALSAHLFRLKMTLQEFLKLEEEEKNPNVKFNLYSNDFKKLINAIKDKDLIYIDSLLMKNRYLIQMNDDFRQTPLHIAAKRDNPEIIKLLLEYGAKIDFEDCTGQTPLHISSKYNQIENVKILLLGLASPFKEDHQGNTADKLTTNKYIKFFINKCKTITKINLTRINMKKSIIYIRNGLKFFFEMKDKQLKTIVDE